MRTFILVAALWQTTTVASADPAFELSRCETVPLANQQASFRIDGVERTRWHFGHDYPRPFFFPFNGPSGQSLTRMGHPGAPNHDHHRSLWLAHKDVNGFDFWSDRTKCRIRQKSWQCYSDGNMEGTMASALGWFDDDGNELMQLDFVAALIPLHHNEHALELQLTLRPADGRDAVELGKTNFGILAVRVAKTLAVHFGGGQLTSSEGLTGEDGVFGKKARWMDYSGPVAVGKGSGRTAVIEGITYFDHPENPRYPTPWHVREDGWMGASFNMNGAQTITKDRPLVLRYLLHAHRGAYDQARASSIQAAFAKSRRFAVQRSSRKHDQFSVQRLSE